MIRRRHSKQSFSGFTLTEALIVVAIAGILAAIAAPGWLSFANQRRANRATDQILQTIRQAQSDAKRVKRDKTITFDPDADVPTVAVDGIVAELGEGDFNPGVAGLQVSDSAGNAVNQLVLDPSGGLDVIQPPNLPLRISVSVPPGGNITRCVIVETLLVATRTARGDECTTP